MPDLRCVQLRRGQLKCDVVLTTYELIVAEQDNKRLGAISWMYVIVDEAHRLKNAKSKLRGQLLQLQYAHLLLLTGAPRCTCLTSNVCGATLLQPNRLPDVACLPM